MSATERPYPDLRSANLARQAEWDKDDSITLSYRGDELAGEVGEACNVIKKLDRERMGIRGSRDTIEHLAEELADVVICADLIAIHRCDVAICAWGAHPMARGKSQVIVSQITPARPAAYCFGTTKSGAPKHPLYIATETQLQVFRP